MASTKAPFVNPGVPGVQQYFPSNEPEIGTLYSSNKSPPKLFQPITIRSTTFKNRIWVSPMCQCSSDNGHATDWHLVNLGTYAARGVGAITMEATAVVPEGRISPEDAGIWTDSQIPPLKRIVEFCHGQGTKIGIQLAHAGRKGSTLAFWVQGDYARTRASHRAVAYENENGWPDNVQAPSAIPFAKGYPLPKEMTLQQIKDVQDAYVEATLRSEKAGFDFIELHAAHGYLSHEFYSPLSNHRTDQYGGSLENRIRFLVEIVERVRTAWPTKPLFVRISAVEYAEGPEKVGDDYKQWGVEQSIILCKRLQALGVDLIDCSSGGNWSLQKIPLSPGYQVPFASVLKSALPNILIGAVGLITDAHQAEEYLQQNKADVIYLARELMRNADWALNAAKELGVAIKPANQLERAWVDMIRPRKEKSRL
ncbi:NADH:flavin oxidoreductase/NADH oxidase [Sistotremastrum suecicum HHB10207 ss-3]|uniref:NADH:flavin oxidoreductase/NADH oxidase n=1 Tax=Sistotremastrum suecicum HHB10207 ss-3 TaxID=1314776 RepID=A0A166G6R0_9AGAM|nr:NADH:flavin oxidoreductase/NADH oxidase [Sistotremastrum suecicum HHB10207 ss-3]